MRAFCIFLWLLCSLLAESFDIDAHRIMSTMAAVYTPMKSGGFELDLDIIPAYAEYLVTKNITNVLPAGTNGESLSLTVAERKQLAEAWAAVASKNGLKIYMHIGCESLLDTMDLAKHAAQTQGVTGIVSMTPLFFKPTVESLHDWLAAVAAVAPSLPFWFYHFPQLTGVLSGQANDLMQFIDKSKKIPNFMGVKYTDYDLLDFQACTQVGGPAKYNMLYGRDEQVLPALVVGAQAAISSTVQYSYTLREAIQLYSQGDIKNAQAAQLYNVKLIDTFKAYAGAGEVNVQKSIMKMTGLDVGPSRLPKVDLTDEQYKALEKALTDGYFIDVPAKAAMVV